MLQSPARPDERQRCHWDYCRACVLPCRRHRAPGSPCSPPACLASEQVTDCGRRVLSLASISILKKKMVKKQATTVFSLQSLLCARSLHPKPCIITCVLAVSSAPHRRTKASRGQGNRRNRIAVKLQHFGLCVYSAFSN